jgi:hypothetical protein
VQAKARQALGVPALVVRLRRVTRQEPLRLVDGDDELQVGQLVGDEPHRINRLIDAGRNADEPDQRQAPAHGIAQRDVLGMGRVGPAVLVAQQPVGALGIVVRRALPRRGECRPEAQGGVEHRGLADPALAVEERDPSAAELEAGELFVAQ